MEAIGQMTGGVAHAVNNPPTIIVGNPKLLEMGGPTPSQNERIDDALSAAEAGADLTARLHLFRRKGELRPSGWT